MSDDIQTRSIDVFVRTLKVDAARVTEDARIIEDLGAESMQSVELIAAFEEEFDIDIDEQEAANNKTVGQTIAFIRDKVS